jgi:hypothetical protein
MDGLLPMQYGQQSDRKVLWDQLNESYKCKIMLHVSAFHIEMFMVRLSNCQKIWQYLLKIQSYVNGFILSTYTNSPNIPK